MYRLPQDAIAGFIRKGGGDRYPQSVDTVCPSCGRQVNFHTATWHEMSNTTARYTFSRCSGCGSTAAFYWTGRDVRDSNFDQFKLFMHPSPKLGRRPVDGIDEIEEFSDALRRTYLATLTSFNTRQWIAAAVLCGRMLEGITKTVMPEEKKSQSGYWQLAEFPDHVDLEQPILDLTDGIRKGRNIAAHFDEHIEPDQDLTEMMVDLLDYLIEFLFVLPRRISLLHDRLATVAVAESSSANGEE